jgi:hypothetical protein
VLFASSGSRPSPMSVHDSSTCEAISPNAGVLASMLVKVCAVHEPHCVGLVAAGLVHTASGNTPTKLPL